MLLLLGRPSAILLFITTIFTLWGSHTTQFAISQVVLGLDSGTFPTVIAEGTPILVVFQAPWCGHCNSLNPELQLVAHKLNENKIMT